MEDGEYVANSDEDECRAEKVLPGNALPHVTATGLIRFSSIMLHSTGQALNKEGKSNEMPAQTAVRSIYRRDVVATTDTFIYNISGSVWRPLLPGR